MRYTKPRAKKETYVILSPKNDTARKRMDYHTDRWVLRKEEEALKFSREPGPWLTVISRDGKKCLVIKKNGDIDFDVRTLD